MVGLLGGGSVGVVGPCDGGLVGSLGGVVGPCDGGVVGSLGGVVGSLGGVVGSLGGVVGSLGGVVGSLGGGVVGGVWVGPDPGGVPRCGDLGGATDEPPHLPEYAGSAGGATGGGTEPDREAAIAGASCWPDVTVVTGRVE